MRPTRFCTAATVAAACVMAILVTQPAQAQTYRVLHTFTREADGENPYSGVIQDPQGNLYGTTHLGGVSNAGAVFKLGKTGRETVLYSFCSQSDCSDGEYPFAGLGLIRDAEGNLYGTTVEGGVSNAGTVFKLGKTGKETVLYSFCSQSDCSDGEYPEAGLIRDVQGNFYGTTAGFQGSQDVNPGNVFKLDKMGKETVLYSFCSQPLCFDGGVPYAGVIQDAKGNLYGTTSSGGASVYDGTVFKLSKTGHYTVLHSFCTQSGCSDGDEPYAGVIQDAKGNLYGTTYYGGDTSCFPPYGCGVVFKLSKTGELTVLHSFTWGTDGGFPIAGVILDANGNLYGTTTIGGDLSCGQNGGGCGVVFRLDKTGKLTVLHTFTGTHGGTPRAGVIQDAEGNLYGTTDEGGGTLCGGLGCGVVFKLTP